MIDITEKDVTARCAVVEGVVVLKPGVIRLIRNKEVPKGDVLEAAKIAGFNAAKKTADLLPYCHPLAVESVLLDFSLTRDRVRVHTTVKAHARTGVEMEAFTATAVACLTIYDMCKAFDRDAVISDIKLIKKNGGKSGSYERKLVKR
ncbi:MAG: cyclic pyranopterin monophosphate synthase MoaC [Candidatus Omnitrophota bacterium]|jgi:cyclic pyranopterin phosphate synthase